MDIKLVDGALHIVLSISSGILSKTGKTKVVASTGGFVRVAGTDISVNITAIKPK